MRFLPTSDHVFIQYSWGCDKTFVHLIFWRSSRCIVDVRVSGKQSRVWRHESKFWERGSKTPGGLCMNETFFFSQLFLLFVMVLSFFLLFSSGGILGGRCKTEGWMDKMDLSQVVIKFDVIEHGLINRGIAHSCDNSTLMISTIKVPPSLMAKPNSWNCYQIMF